MMQYTGLQLVGRLTILSLVLISCKEKPSEKIPMLTDLIFDGPITELLDKAAEHGKVQTLVLDTKVTCEDLQKICQLPYFPELEYLSFYDLDCNSLPIEFTRLAKLEKLIVNSNTLDHIPILLLELPSLQHLQFETMDFNTYLGAIPSQCRLEEIEFQTTPVRSLGTLSRIPSLKTVGILENKILELENEEIKLVHH